MADPDYDALFAAALGGSSGGSSSSSGGGGGGGASYTDHAPQLVTGADGRRYYWDPDSPDVFTPVDNQPTVAPAFDDYGSAVWQFDGPGGGVYRASNGQYVYQNQVFNTLSEVNSLITAQSGGSGGGGAETIKQGPDGQYYELGPDGTFQLIPGMPTGSAAAHTQIVTINGMSTLVDTQTGETIRVIGPAGSPSSSGGGSSGGSSSAPRAATPISYGTPPDNSSAIAALNAQQQRDWQGAQNDADRAQRAAEFAQTYGLQAANYQLSLRGAADNAAKTYGELVSSADTAALPAYLSAGGGSIWNALNTGNSMLTDNAVRPGAMALQDARWYQGQLGGGATGGSTTGGGGVPQNPFDPNNPAPGDTYDGPGQHVPGTGGTPGTGNHGGGGVGGGATIVGSGKGQRYTYPQLLQSQPETQWQSEYNQILNTPQQETGYHPTSASENWGTIYPGSTFMSGSTLMVNTVNGPVPASYVDPASLANPYNNPFNTTANASADSQRLAAADPRSQNPNLNLNSIERSSYVQPPASAATGAAPPFGQNYDGTNRQTPSQFPIPTISGPTGQSSGGGTAATGGWVYNPGSGYSLQAPQSWLQPSSPGSGGPRTAAPNITRAASGGMIRGIGIVGDQPNGKPTGHEELVFAPQGAMVVPMNKIAGHAKGGAIDPFAPAGSTGSTAPVTGTTYDGPAQYQPSPTPMTSLAPSTGTTGPVSSAVMPTPTPTAPAPSTTPAPTPVTSLSPIGAAAGGTTTATGQPTTNSSGYTIVNGPDVLPPGTQLPSTATADEVRQYRENFPIPQISGPNGALNPFDVAWQNVDPLARSVFYNANQTRYGIPAQSQDWESQRYAMPGMARPAWGY